MATLQPLSPRPVAHPRGGFTLVEVALAIGIVAFAFVALLALLPAGNTAFRKSIDVAVCGQISQRVINDAQMADFRTLVDAKHLSDDASEYFAFRAPTVAKGEYRYFDDQGREIMVKSGDSLTSEEKRKVIYVVNTRIVPRAKLPSLREAPQTTSFSGAKVQSQPLAQITVQVAHNPNLVDLPLSSASPSSDDPARCLWDPKVKQAGIEIYTYAGLVGRND
jgi:uncharacterized protein (TIGR02598 family)